MMPTTASRVPLPQNRKAVTGAAAAATSAASGYALARSPSRMPNTCVFSGSSVQSNRRLNETVGGMNILTGNSGNNVLNGGTNADRMVGGEGADSFFFRAGFGHDTVMDFSSGDIIDLAGTQMQFMQG